MATMLNQSPQALSLMNLKNIVKTTDKIRADKQAQALTGMAQGANNLAGGSMPSQSTKPPMAGNNYGGPANMNSGGSAPVFGSGDVPPGWDKTAWWLTYAKIAKGDYSGLGYAGGAQAPAGMSPEEWQKIEGQLKSGDFKSLSPEMLKKLIYQGVVTMSNSKSDPKDDPITPPEDPPITDPGDQSFPTDPENPDEKPVTPVDDPTKDSPTQARIREFARLRGYGVSAPPAQNQNAPSSTVAPSPFPAQPGGIPVSPTPGKPPGDTKPVEPVEPGGSAMGLAAMGGAQKKAKTPQEELEQQTFGRVVRSY